MAILNIVKDGDDILRKKSKAVEKIDQKILTLINDMWDTLKKSGGVGLAAPQIGILKQICVIDTGDEKLCMINPEIVKKEGNQEELEGCLSCPDKWGITKRPQKVTIRTTTLDGKRVLFTGEDLMAKAICHEYDHLYGILFYDNAIRMLTKEEIEELQ